MFSPIKILRTAVTSVVFTLLTNLVVSCFSTGDRPVLRTLPEEAGPTALGEVLQSASYTGEPCSGQRPADVPDLETCHHVWRISEHEGQPGRRRAARATYTLKRLDLTGGYLR